MNAARSAGLVSRWVALYTLGLPADLRDARREEIEGDLWSQHEEASLIGRPDGSLAGEMLTRLVLGVPADISWRLAHLAGSRARSSVERRTTLGTRVVGLLAILGGSAVAIAAAAFVAWTWSAPNARPWSLAADPLQSSLMTVAGDLGIVGLAAATAGLAILFQDRVSGGAALAASIGFVGGVLGILGAYSLLFLLPAGSAYLVWDLARARVLGRGLSVAHVASAVGFFVLIGAFMSNTPIGVAVVLALFYPLSWLAIGGSLMRGVPITEPGTPGA